jgi:hypothetical protein
MIKTFNRITPAQRITRWKHVLRVLKGLSRHDRQKHFNMATWGYKTDCGTVACAAGHCGLDPWFRRQGFKLKFNDPYTGEPTNNADEGDSFQPEDFFGSEGCNRVFYQTDASYQGTIRNTKKYIARLERDAVR